MNLVVLLFKLISGRARCPSQPTSYSGFLIGAALELLSLSSRPPPVPGLSVSSTYPFFPHHISI